MCIVSMVYDYGRKLPNDLWDRPKWEGWKRLLEEAGRADRELKQPDCEDPAKASWMREIEARLKKLETGEVKA